MTMINENGYRLTVLAMTPMGSGYWWVRRANRAVKEQRPAVNRIKNGNSFFGYTETSWKAATERYLHGTKLFQHVSHTKMLLWYFKRYKWLKDCSYSVIMLSSTNDFMWQVCITYEGVILYLHSLYTWGKGKTGAPSPVGRGSFWKLQNRSNMYMYG